MRLIALIFAVLAIVPQALRGMAYGLTQMNECALPAVECEIAGNDQSHIINLLWGPNWFTTTGLWIGGIGLLVTIVIIKVMTFIDDRKSQAAMNRADKRSGVGHGSKGPGANHSAEGRMPRPPAFDRYGRPRD